MNTTGAMTEQKRQVLEMVAEGKVTPEDAARLLIEIDRQSAPDLPETPQPPAPPEPPAPAKVTAVRVLGSMRAVRVEGDPTVTTATAEGPYRLRYDGTMMVFDEDPAEMEDDEDELAVWGPPRRGKVRMKGRIGGRRIVWGGTDRPELRVRMNPKLPLFLDLTAGSARVRGIRGPITAEITAGSARMEDVQSPLNLTVEAGSVRIAGKFDQGDSRVRVSAGAVRIDLDPESDVKIKAHATLGKVSLPGVAEGDTWFLGGGSRKATVGSGKGNLEVEATTGSVAIGLA